MLTGVCAGRSMAPTLLPGDRVEVLECGPSSVRPGQAVVFRGSGDYDIVHRFVFKVPFAPYFVHQGDASARVGLARCDRIIGIVPLPARPPSLGARIAGWRAVIKRASLRMLMSR